MAKNRQAADEPPTISYLVKCAGQPDFIVQVRADWKLTFGAVNPGAKDGGRYDLHCLRVWEGEKLRAVFCDVRAFRDLSLPLAFKIERETGSATWESDSDGNFERNEKQIVERSWSPPEDPAEIPF